MLQDKYAKKNAIKASFIDKVDNTITVDLEPGPYILFSKIEWKKWQKRNFTISAYGPFDVKFEKFEKWDIRRLEEYI